MLDAIRSDSGEHRSYRVDRMQGATVTSQVFAPRYAVELTSTGPLTVVPFNRNAASCQACAPRPEPDIKGRPTFIDARSAERHSIRKEWMARLILTRITEDRPVTGGMAHMCGRNTEGEQLQRYRRSPLWGPDGHDPVASRKFLQEIFTAQRSCVVCNAPFSDTFCFLFWCPHET